MVLNLCCVILLLCSLLAARGDGTVSSNGQNVDKGAAPSASPADQGWYGGLGKHSQNFGAFVNRVSKTSTDLKGRVAPLTKYVELGKRLLSWLSKEEMNDKQKLNAFSESITEAITSNIQQSRNIPPIEISSHGKYTCGGKGVVSDLTTIQHVNTKINSKGDTFEIRVIYKFDDLKFDYRKFHVESLGIVSLDGTLNLQFGENQIELTIGVPTVKNIVQSLRNPSALKCIIRILDFKALKLKYDHHNFIALSHFRRGLINKEMETYFKDNESVLQQQFESQALQEVHRILTQDSYYSVLVCNDDQLKQLLVQKGGTVEAISRPETFKAHCSED